MDESLESALGESRNKLLPIFFQSSSTSTGNWSFGITLSARTFWIPVTVLFVTLIYQGIEIVLRGVTV